MIDSETSPKKSGKKTCNPFGNFRACALYIGTGANNIKQKRRSNTVSTELRYISTDSNPIYYGVVMAHFVRMLEREDFEDEEARDAAWEKFADQHGYSEDIPQTHEIFSAVWEAEAAYRFGRLD